MLKAFNKVIKTLSDQRDMQQTNKRYPLGAHLIVNISVIAIMVFTLGEVELFIIQA